MIPLDKQAHFLSGYALAMTIGLFNPLLGLLAAFVAGAAKELYDHFHPLTHTADWSDFAATSAGGVLATLVLIGIYQ